jgi:Carboxypeptidase regulatory-like domain/TonB-dependent Receptor Plug Domain
MMPMRESNAWWLRVVFIVALTAAWARPLLAQDVRVLVVDRASGAPLVGAIVSLVLANGSRRTGALTDEEGSATLHGTLGGRVRVRAERIGYATDSSAALELTADPQAVRIALVPQPLLLEKVAVRATRTCRMDPNTGTVVARLWGEVHKALDATVLSAPQRLPIDVWRYTRILDRSLRVVAETTATRSVPAGAPFLTAPPEELSELGFAHQVDGDLTYFAPDAALLLSDQFARGHCFGVKEVPGSQTLIGLTFDPAPGRRVSDVTGVLWVDRQTGELRWMDYAYTRPPAGAEPGQAGGRLEFAALPNGQWIVERWYIRLPRMARVGAARIGAFSVPARDSLLGYREEGGWAATASRKGAATADMPTLTGLVFDSLHGVPLTKARLLLAGGVADAVTDSTGRYRLRSVLAGRYRLTTDDPRLTHFSTEGAEREVVLSRGEVTVADWAVASAATLRARFCGKETGRGDRPQLIIGYLVDSLSRAPVGGARAVMSWRRIAVQASERLVSAAVGDSTVETESDEAGIVTFCRPPRQDVVRLRAELGGARVERSVPADDDTASVVEVSLTLSTAAAGSTTLRGRVLIKTDSATRPAAAAEVLLPGLSKSARTTADGGFAFAMLARGTYTVLVRDVGYRPVLARVTVPLPADSVREFVLTPISPELPGVAVTATAVSSKMRGFEERRLTNVGGRYITRADLAKHEEWPLSDVLRSVPGVRLVRRPDNTVFLESTRSAFAATISKSGTDTCAYQVYLDGALVFQPGRGPSPPNIDDFAPNGIEAIEIYAGPASTPMRFSGIGAACGTIVLWTRAP